MGFYLTFSPQRLDLSLTVVARGDTLIVVTNGSTVLHQLNDIFA